MKLSQFERTTVALLAIRIMQFVCVGFWLWFWIVPDSTDYRMISVAFCCQALLAEFAGDYRVKLSELRKEEWRAE